MNYNIGDKVFYKENKTIRRILDINSQGQLLLWGMWQYVDANTVKAVR